MLIQKLSYQEERSKLGTHFLVILVIYKLFNAEKRSRNKEE